MGDVGDIYKMVVKGRLAGTVETRNMFTYEQPTGSSTDAASHIAMRAGLAILYNDLMPLIASVFDTYSIESHKYSTGHWYPVTESAFTHAGSVVADFESFQTATLILAKTAALRTVGRKFFAGVTKNCTLDGAMTTAALAVMATILVDYLATLSGTGSDTYVPGVLDKVGIFRPFVGGSVGTLLSSMRRRKPGYGI